MPDTYTTFLQEPEPKDREQSIEAYVKARLQSLDRAVAGYTSVSLQGLSGNVDLTPTQAKHRRIKLTGAPSGAVTVRVPYATGSNADIIFTNACTGSNSAATLKSMGANTGNSAGVSLASGEARYVYHDGESVYAAAPAVYSASPGGVIAARVYNSADIAIGNASATALTFNSERRDDGGLHDTGTNTDRLTAPVAGWYNITGHAQFASNATGFRSASIRRNAGGTIIVAATLPAVNGDVTALNPTCLYYLAAGDYVRLFVFQTSGAALNIVATPGEFGCEFSMVKIG